MTPDTVALLAQGGGAGLVIIMAWMFLQHLDKVDKRNQEFMKEQRLGYNEALGRLAEEIKMIASIVTLVRDTMVQHDAKVDTRLSQIPLPQPPNTGPLRQQ